MWGNFGRLWRAPEEFSVCLDAPGTCAWAHPQVGGVPNLFIEARQSLRPPAGSLSRGLISARIDDDISRLKKRYNI